jgi:hypothetical protein
MPTTIPTTTSSTRPGSPSAGDAYFETDTKNYIIYDGAYWRAYNNDGISSVLTQGISLDGNSDYGTVPNDTAIAISGDLSLLCWVYFDTAKYTPIISKRTTTTNYDFYWRGDNGTNVLGFYDGSVGRSSTGTVSTGGWHHVAVVIDSGTSSTFYIDGVSAGSPGAFTITSNSDALQFGYLPTTEFLDGKMDDIAIYNRVLSGSEVSSIKNGIFPTNGLAGLWTFEGDTGSSFTDKSGNGNDGTLSGTASLISVTSH